MSGQAKTIIAAAADSAVAASGTKTVTLVANGLYRLRRIEVRIDGATDNGSRDATISVQTDGSSVNVFSMPLDQFLPINLLEASTEIAEAGVSSYNPSTYEFAGWRKVDIPFQNQCVVKITNNDTVNTTNIKQLYAEASQ